MNHLVFQRWQSALCVALTTAGTMLILATVRIPHSYMGIVFALTLSLLPRTSSFQFLHQLLAVTLGTITAVLLLTAFPEEPWFYIPMLGVIATNGYAFFLKRWGPGSAAAFSFFFLAIHVAAIAGQFFNGALPMALNFWAQAVIAIGVTYFVALIIQKEKVPRSTFVLPLSSKVTIGVAVCIAGLIDVSIRTDQGGRLMVATISTITILETTQLAAPLVKKLLGYFIGIGIAAAFIVIAVAAGNSISIYLLLAGLTFGTLEWLAGYYRSSAIIYRSIAMMVSYCIMMTPTPYTSLHIPYQRTLSSLVGFFVATLVFLIGRECRKITPKIS